MTTTFRVLMVLFIVPLSPALVDAEELDGKKIFVDSNCHTCHSVDSQTIQKTGTLKFKGGDLSSIGDKRKEPEWLKSYLKGEKKGGNGLKHNQIRFEGTIFEGLPNTQFKGTDEELEALAQWLATLKKSKK